MKKLLRLLVPVIALGGGIVGGQTLRPSGDAMHQADPAAEARGETPEGHGTKSATETDDAHTRQAHHDRASSGHGSSGQGDVDERTAWFTFPSQFFVPLMRNGDLGAMMIVTLTIETDATDLEKMRQQEHRLRDALLRQLMIQANTGGFDGNFTTEPSQRVLREQLLQAARAATDLTVESVLIEDIARQTS